MNGKTKKIIPSIFITIIFLVTFNIISFIAFENRDANFWCGYAFITLAALCLIAVQISMSLEPTEGYYLNAPGLLVSGIHLAVQLVFGIVVMALSAVNIKVALCVHIVILAVYATIIISLFFYKKTIRK